MAFWNRCSFIILVLLVPDLAGAQDPNPRYELGGLTTCTFLREIGSRDAGIGTETGGFGGRLVYRAFPLLDLETEINILPGNPATSGDHVQGFFGVKAGKRWEKGGIFLKVRSVIRYAQRTVRTSQLLPTFEAGGFTTHNWQGSFGISVRF